MATSKKRKTSSYKWSPERRKRFEAKKYTQERAKDPLPSTKITDEMVNELRPTSQQYSIPSVKISDEMKRDDLYGMFNRPDMVNHPPHYNAHPSGIECIDIVEWLGFNIGSAVKYLWRAPYKMPSQLEDYRKAIWYIQREIERLEKSWSKGRREIHGPR